MASHALLISDATQTCGVEEFARQAAIHLGGRGRTVILGGALEAALANADDLVINLPVVAWKKRLLAPIVAAARARRLGRDVTLVLHEWADLALARRISYLPLLPFATRILFSSPEVKSQFEATPVSVIVTRRRGILPIPPNFALPDEARSSAIAERLAGLRGGGRMILGQFGSIYPRKDPAALLEVAGELLRRGVDLHLVFIGSFVADGGAGEAEFRARAAALGIADRVEVTGYIDSAETLFGIFAEVDVFLYPLSEGLTSRRGSVLAAAMSGRPVLVTAPARADSLAHHRLFATLVAEGNIQFVPLGATPATMADAVLATRGVPRLGAPSNDDIGRIWGDVIEVLDA